MDEHYALNCPHNRLLTGNHEPGDASGSITAVNAVGPTGLLRRSTANGSTWNQSYYAYNWRGDAVNRLDKDGSLVSNSTCRAYGASRCAPGNLRQED